MSRSLLERMPQSASVLSGSRQISRSDVLALSGHADVRTEKLEGGRAAAPLVPSNAERERIRVAGEGSFSLAANVALRGDAAFLFKWLSLLDGRAKRVILLPQSADGALVDLAVSAGGAEWLITDEVLENLTLGNCKLHVDTATTESSVDGGLAGPAYPRRPRDCHLAADTQWVLATSGTTSTPKLVAHTLTSLTRSMKIDPRFSQTRWGLMYDPARFAGMQVFLQSLLNGAQLLAPPADLDLVKQLQWLGEKGCDALSATPTLWRKMLMSGGLDHLTLKQITLGGEIADASTINALTRLYPEARLTHVYASTEAGVGFAVHDKQAGFPADWLGSSVRGTRLRIGENGCLWVAPSSMEQQYLGRIDVLPVTQEGWLDTGDVVRVEGERVYFCGRLNGSVNIGGNKVFPEEVENVIREVSGVASAVVRARPSSVMGNLIDALIVASPGAPASNELVAEVKRHCREKLDSYKVPAFVKLVDEIAVSSAGKISRNQ